MAGTDSGAGLCSPREARAHLRSPRDGKMRLGNGELQDRKGLGPKLL